MMTSNRVKKYRCFSPVPCQQIPGVGKMGQKEEEEEEAKSSTKGTDVVGL